MSKQTHYFAPDGNYGDATGIVIVDTTHFTEGDWDTIAYSAEQYRVGAALEISRQHAEAMREGTYVHDGFEAGAL